MGEGEPKVGTKKTSFSRKSLEASLAILKFFQGGLRDVTDHVQHRLAVHHVFQPRPDDVFLATYPKSGTTLMQMMLYQMTTDGNMDFPHINSVSPYFDQELRQAMGRALHHLPSPRVFKTHFLYRQLPRNGRFIYMVRDARDVAISAYHHHCLMRGKPGQMEEFIDSFLRDQMGYGSWFRHIESWWPHRNDSNVLFLRYEEAIADLAGTARRIAGFCGLPLKEEDLPRIVERCGVEFMKRYDHKFDPRLHQMSSEVGTFIRKGKAGDGRAAFSAEQNRMLAQRLAKLARKLGDGADDHPLLCPRLDPQEAAAPSRS
jgi:hypothetical protein